MKRKMAVFLIFALMTGCMFTGCSSSISVKNLQTILVSVRQRMYIKNDGSLWVWGTDVWGELSIRTNTNKHLPLKILDDVALPLR